MSILEKLANNLNEDRKQVENFLSNASKKYKVYAIPKRTYGHRIIAQPSKQLKLYQNTFLTLYSIPAHACAMAYRKKQNIRENALAHCQQGYLLKMDFENFFNSIKPDILWKNWELTPSLPNFTKTEKLLIEQLLFWCPSKKTDGKLVLSVGAPSSPVLSNLCMYEFDEMLNKQCQEKDITYTRYADDLTFSTNHKKILFDTPETVKNLLLKYFEYNLIINHSKTIFSSKAHNRHVTGVTLTNEGILSLGRKRKRYIKHLVHQFQINHLDKEDICYLQGILAMAKHIEPNFILTLENKYTNQLIKNIFKVKDEENK
jgi:retron-type reverse transcriptase